MQQPMQALIVLILITLLALVENLPLIPWSPLMIGYGVSALILPFLLRKPSDLGLKRPSSYSVAALWVVIWFVAYYALASTSSKLYADYLVSTRQVGNPQIDYSAAQAQVFRETASRSGMDVKEFLRLVPLGPLLWAPIAEELLYRGYGYLSLSASGFLKASSVTTVFFALRHAVQFSSLPAFALLPILIWSMQLIPFGFFASHLVHRTGSIYPPILLHFLVNLPPHLNL